MNNDDFGRFLISKNVINGKSIRYTFREKSHITKLNGWTIYSMVDKWVTRALNQMAQPLSVKLMLKVM